MTCCDNMPMPKVDGMWAVTFTTQFRIAKIMNIEQILANKQVQEFIAGDMDYYDLPENIRFELYRHFEPEMPYGTAKGRTGDPDQWILYHIERWYAKTKMENSGKYL